MLPNVNTHPNLVFWGAYLRWAALVKPANPFAIMGLAFHTILVYVYSLL